jgi:hypothetical protein
MGEKPYGALDIENVADYIKQYGAPIIPSNCSEEMYVVLVELKKNNLLLNIIERV